MKIYYLLVYLVSLFILNSCQMNGERQELSGEWEIAALPSSVRLDPVSNEIIDYRYVGSKVDEVESKSLLDENWIYEGSEVKLHGARGEYISFQVVLSNYTDSVLSHIKVDIEKFKNENAQIDIAPELFLEWSVEVKTPSTGYNQSSLGEGWYPDALIPIKHIQQDSSKVHRWTYPLWLPDFNNRIDEQRSLVIWIDQYIPVDRSLAMPGDYRSEITLSVAGKEKVLPITLKVWDFALPNQNRFGASLQQEGFVSNKSENKALQIYQLLKRNRLSVMDPTYKPTMEVGEDGEVNIDWNSFDTRLKKYFTGKAFTQEYGYEYGPGYGEPIENFVLPFDVYGKYGTTGWPDIGKPDVERNTQNIAVYIDCIKQVRNHLNTMVDPEKTDLTVYLNGLDESYFKEAWSRMVYFGDLFDKYYPEAHFRIDGAYSDEAMEYVHQSIDYWGSHTINYNWKKVKEYHELGIKDWLYGPMIYESKVNGWVGSSTIMDLPLVNDRAISWACWKYGTHSWLSWGIGAGWKHAWYDPETWKDAYKSGAGSDPEFSYKKINGNGMLIYSGGIVPNVNGPCPSIRLKTMRNGIQEYEYMRLLSRLDGNNKRVDQIVNSIINEPFGENAIGVLDVWEYDAKKWDQERIALGELIHKLSLQQ